MKKKMNRSLGQRLMFVDQLSTYCHSGNTKVQRDYLTSVMSLDDWGILPTVGPTRTFTFTMTMPPTTPPYSIGIMPPSISGGIRF